MSLPLGLVVGTNLPPKDGMCGNVVLKQQRKLVVMQNSIYPVGTYFIN